MRSTKSHNQKDKSSGWRWSLHPLNYAPTQPFPAILDVDASGPVLNEHLGELHGGGDATVSGVSVGNDRIQVVLGFNIFNSLPGLVQ